MKRSLDEHLREFNFDDSDNEDNTYLSGTLYNKLNLPNVYESFILNDTYNKIRLDLFSKNPVKHMKQSIKKVNSDEVKKNMCRRS